ncbi:hypothetical protein OOJ91_04405 [Micromonospora lupini]|uniref:hypothetical protein n=1 Tax=Micromonospora lupini TaxID=285679 RepID=UPI002251A95D|nr:hypothetical protein [Micromonospora lupini]MCX5065118.1 hypothetical protein [Micromonospora lupini]
MNTVSSLSGTRVKLAVCTVLTALAVGVGLPARVVLALALTGLAIPVAVALAGGRRAVRDLLLPVRRRASGSGVGHTSEQGERFVT